MNKRIEWCRKHIQGFAEMHDRAQEVQREQEEYRRRFGRQERQA